MKITKTSKEFNNFKMNEKLANIGCDICPCCGETRSRMECIKNGEPNKGIVYGLTGKTYAKIGLFKMKHYKIDCYSCDTCGAKWESEPYEYY